MIQQKTDEVLPSFFLNSVPKSGTNMMLQMLVGLPGVTHDPTHTFFDPYDFAGSFYRLGQIPKSQFGIGHIYYSPEWSYLLKRLNMKHIFLLRDLRDVVVSMSHFVVEKLQHHQMYDLFHHLTAVAKTPKERLLALIRGIDTDEFQYPDIAAWFAPFRGWLNDPNTFVIKYEDLVRTEESLRQTLARVVAHLWVGMNPPDTIASLVQAMIEEKNPQHVGTYRTGRIGSWQDEFDAEVKAAFQEVTGELLIDLGYEQGEW